jgi:hypothetical protein
MADRQYYLDRAAEYEAMGATALAAYARQQAELAPEGPPRPTPPPVVGAAPPQYPAPSAGLVAPTPPSVAPSILVGDEPRPAGRDLPPFLQQAIERAPPPSPSLADIERQQRQRYREWVDYLTGPSQGIPLSEAERRAAELVYGESGRAMTVEGEPSAAGLGGTLAGLLPFSRESRLVPGSPGFVRDEETGDTRPATTSELLLEPFARQTVMQPEDVAGLRERRQQERAAFMQALQASPYDEVGVAEAYRQYIEDEGPVIAGLLTEPTETPGGAARVVETPMGAAFRGVLGALTGLVGAVGRALPLVYEVERDEDGNLRPVDPDSVAYRMDRLLQQHAPEYAAQGYLVPQDIPRMPSGPMAGAVLARSPRPFQPYLPTEGTLFDPEGQRAIETTGRALVDLSQAIAVGRGLGDEAASLPRLTVTLEGPLEDPSVPWWEYLAHPFVLATAGEALLPTTGIGTTARLLGRGARAGSTFAAGRGLQRTARALTVASDPLEFARARKTARRAELVLDGLRSDAADIAAGLDTATVRAQAAEAVASEVAGPGALVTAARQLEALGVDSVPAAAFDALLGNPHTAAILADVTDNGVVNVAQLASRTRAWREAWELPRVLELVRGGASLDDVARYMGEVVPGWVDAQSDLMRVLRQAGDEDLAMVAQRYAQALGVPARAPSPTVRRALALVDQVAGAAVESGAGAVRGPLARRFLRALSSYADDGVDMRRAWDALQGDDLARMAEDLQDAGVTINRAGIDAIEHALASAVGEDVASTLLESVPADMVRATRDLLVPRAALESGDVVRRVRQVTESLLAGEFTPGPNGAADVRRVYADPAAVAEAYLRAVSPLYVRQSTVARRAVQALRQGLPLDMAQRLEVEDAIRGAAYRQVLADQGVDVVEATIGGRQYTRAGVPVERRGGVADKARAVADLVGGFTPRPVIRAAEAALPDTAREWFRGADAARTPTPLFRALEELREKLPRLGDAFRDEVAAATKAARQRGEDAESGFNTVLAKRQAQGLDAVARDLDQAAADLQAQGMTEAEAWYAVSYQARESFQRGLGAQRMRLPSTPDEVAELRALAIDAAAAAPARESWEGLLRGFFGGPLYDSAVAPHVRRVILRPSVARLPPDEAAAAAELGSAYRPITTGELRAVLEELRQTAPDALRSTGLARVDVAAGVRALFRGEAKRAVDVVLRDDIFRSLSTWALDTDRTRAIRRTMAETLDTHPELRVDLQPSLRTQATRLYPTDAGNLATLGRSSIIGRLRGILAEANLEADELRRATEQLDALERRSLDPEDPLFRLFDALAERLVLNLSPAQRARLTDELAAEMVAQQTFRPDLSRIYDRTLGQAEALQKQATYDRVARAIDVATIRRFPDLPRGLRFDDLLDYIDPGGAGAQRVTQPTGMTARQVLDDVTRTAQAAGQDTTPESPELRTILGILRGAEQQRAGLAYADDAPSLNIVDELAQGYMDGVLGLQGEGLMEGARLELAQQLRSYGLTALADVESGAGDVLVRAVADLDPRGDRMLVYGPEMAEAVANLRNAAQTGRLRQTLADLQRLRGRTGASAAAMGLQLLDHVLTMPRTVAASGALAMGYAYVFPFADEEGPGLPVVMPMPNTRYLGMNLLTAPLIMLTTVGGARMVKTLGESTGARALVDAVTPRARATDIMFTAPDGRAWTWGDLQQAMNDSNILFSRADVEWSQSTARELQRGAQLSAEGAPVSMGRTVARHLDPRMVNPFMSLATATDTYFRRNAFASALRDGASVQEAAQLARNVVLDYGAVPDVIKQYVNRYVLFATFRSAMLQGLADALARDPQTFTSVARLSMREQQAADTWLYGPDYTKVRSWAFPGPTIEGTGTAFYGPANPAAETAGDVINVLAYLAQRDAGAPDEGRLLQAVQDERLLPTVAPFLGRPSRRVGPQGYVDPSYIAYMQYHDAWWGTGLWPWFRDEYKLVALEPDERYPGSETADYGRQYRFQSAEDAARFERLKGLAFILAGRRAVEDGAKLGLTIQPPQGFAAKRRGLSNPLLFAVGAETPMKGRAPEDLQRRALRQAERGIPSAPPR